MISSRVCISAMVLEIVTSCAYPLSAQQTIRLNMTEHEVVIQTINEQKWATLRAALSNQSKQDILLKVQGVKRDQNDIAYYTVSEPYAIIEVRVPGSDFWYPLTRLGSWVEGDDYVIKPGSSVWIEKKLVMLVDKTELQRQQHQSYVKNGLRITIMGRTNRSEEKVTELIRKIVYLPE